MQIVYAPYNAYRWCVSRGLLPENSCLIFGMFQDSSDENDVDFVRIAVDLMADEGKQTYQVLAGVALYNLIEGGCKEGLQEEIEERVSVYFSQWTDDVGEINNIPLEDKEHDFEMDLIDKVLHPTLVMLSVFDDNGKMTDKDVIVLGDIEADVIGKTLSLPDKLYWQQIKTLLLSLQKNERQDVIDCFLSKWHQLKARFVYDDMLKIPDFTREKLNGYVN